MRFPDLLYSDRRLETSKGTSLARRPPAQAHTHDDLAAHLDRGDPLPVYAILGEEPFARTQAIHALREGVLGDADPDMALSAYDGKEAPDSASLLDELRTPPFLAPRRLVIVDNAADLVARSAEALVSYLEKPSKTGVLALTLPKLAKNTRLYKAIDKVGMVVTCDAPRDYQLPQWIMSRSRSHGKRLVGDAAKRLAEYIGVNLPVIDQALLKLSLYVGDRDTVTEDDVEALVEDLPVTTIFKLTDAVGSKSPGRALRLLDNLLAQNNEPTYIVSMIRWALERLIMARTLLDRGLSPAEIGKTLHMRPGFFLDKTLEHARKRTSAELRRGFSLLLETDLATKTSVADSRDLLEHLLLKLCG